VGGLCSDIILGQVFYCQKNSPQHYKQSLIYTRVEPLIDYQVEAISVDGGLMVD
jgi:hypothetical protein